MRILSALHHNEARTLSSAYNILPVHYRHQEGRLVKFCQFIYNLITCDMILLLFGYCTCMCVYF